MWKYIVAFVVIFGFSVYVFRQTQQIAEQGVQQTTQASSGTPSSNAQQDAKIPKWYIQFLYRLFTWPEGVTAWAIILTLMAIAEQTKQTTEASRAGQAAAEAAQLNAQAVINSERAWILVKRILPPKELVPPSPLTGQALEQEALRLLANDLDYIAANEKDRYRMTIVKKEEIRASTAGLAGLWVLMIGFRFKVYGNTPARIIESALIFRVVDGRPNGLNTEPDLPESPDYGTPSNSEEIPDMGTVLAPAFQFTSGVPLFGGKLSPEEVIDISERKKFLCAYGFVRYRDSFEKTPDRETRFCYFYDVKLGGVYIEPNTGKRISPDAFRVGGPPEYNRAT